MRWRESALGLVLLLALASGAFGAVPVPTPLTGTVTLGSWLSFDQNYTGVTLASGKPFHFNVILPPQYNPSLYKYPLLVWLHPNEEGNPWYTGGNTNPLFLTTDDAANYNSVAFQTAHPSILLVPYADQSTDTCGGCLENWGGWVNSGVVGSGTVYSGDTGPNVFATRDAVAYAVANYAVDTTRIYLAGWSLGGIGTEYQMLTANTVNGSQGKIFAAGYTLAGGLDLNGGSGPTGTQITAMTNVPLWNFAGPGSTNDPDNWDTTLCENYQGGSTTYAAPQASASTSRCGISQHYLWWCPSCGDQNTDQNGNNIVAATNPMNWLFSVTSAGTTGNFTANSSGQIIAPNGAPFVPRGIDVFFSSLGDAWTTSSTTPLTTLFPGINMVRIYDSAYNPPSAYTAYVNELTAAGIVVCIVDSFNWTGSDDTSAGNGGGGSGVVFTGSVLTTELNWYTALATAFANNPYVWLGSNNEPSYSPSLAALSTWHQQTYNAIRGTGNNNIIMIDEPAGGNPNTMGPSNGMTASVYAAFTNAVWDLHYYNWISGYSTNQATVTAGLTGSPGNGIQGALSLPMNGGTAPLIIGEYGNSTNGTSIDAGWVQTVNAVTSSGYGSTAWAWNPGGTGDVLQSGHVLTTYGQQVAAFIAAAVPTESLTMNPIGTQLASTAFQVQGAISGLTSAPTLQYSDNGGAFAALPSPTVTATGYSFLNPGLAAGASNTVTVRDQNNTTASATSNTFAVGSAPSGCSGTSTTTWSSSLSSATMALSGGNLIATAGAPVSGSGQTAVSSTSKASGKYFFQITGGTLSANWAAGLINSSFTLASGGGLGSDANGIGYYPVSPANVAFYNNTELAAPSTADSNGAVFSFAVDFTTQLLWVQSPEMVTLGLPWNASSTATPVTETGGWSFGGMSGAYSIGWNELWQSGDVGTTATLNTVGPFSIAIPSGFAAWDMSACHGFTTAIVLQ